MTATITPTTRLTVLKHLAGGKDLTTVAEITRIPRSTVVDVANHHGFPKVDSLKKAVELLTAKIEREATTLPERAPESARAVPTPSPVASPRQFPDKPQALTQPDEVRVLLNTAKAHPSKRIQAAANRVFDDLAKLRQLLRDDETKNAERRKAEAEKAAARAEVERLKRALAEAQAKLRGKSVPQSAGGQSAAADGALAARGNSALLSNSDLEPLGLDSKQLRSWAVENGVDCPGAGRLPRRILDAWRAAHTEAAAS